MRYATPELNLVGKAKGVVLGTGAEVEDNIQPPDPLKPLRDE